MAPGLAWRICAALQLRRAVEHGASGKEGGSFFCTAGLLGGSSQILSGFLSI